MADADDKPGFGGRAKGRAAVLRAAIAKAIGRTAPPAAEPSARVPAAAQSPASSPISADLAAQARAAAAPVQSQARTIEPASVGKATTAAPGASPGTVNRFGKEVLPEKAQQGHAIGRDQAAEQRNNTASPRIERPAAAPSAAPVAPAQTPSSSPQLDAAREKIIGQIRERYPSPPHGSDTKSPDKGMTR